MAGPVVPQRYLDAIGEDDPIDVMEETPGRVRKLLRGLTEKQLARKPAPGKWSIKEILAHLLDGEVVLGARYRFIAGMDRPQLVGYDQDAFVERLGVANAKTADLLADFEIARAVNLGLFERLPDDAWDRVGLHAERGEESIRSMVTMYAGHDRIHVRQMETIRVGLFPARQPRVRRAASRASGAAAGARKREAKPPAKKGRK